MTPGATIGAHNPIYKKSKNKRIVTVLFLLYILYSDLRSDYLTVPKTESLQLYKVLKVSVIFYVKLTVREKIVVKLGAVVVGH